MGYVAIKGGGKAINASEELLELLRSKQSGDAMPLDIDTIMHQLHSLNSRVLSEGGLYHPELSALAIKQCMGDTLEAAFTLRAYRSTRPRIVETAMHDTRKMRVIRRISAAFKDIPGGQTLGPATDYQLRLMRMDLLDESPESFQAIASKWLKKMPDEEIPLTFPKVVESLRADGLLPPVVQVSRGDAFDITREPMIFPVPRSAALATMARAEQGGLLSLAYSNMRGYGDIHPTVAELRVGYLPVYMPHPISGEDIEIGEILMTECEVVAMYEKGTDQDAKAHFTLGYGACFGHNEVKAISMAILDRALQMGASDGPSNPSEDAEFVLLHIDGIDSMGFCTHYKMPHYVTFQSDMDRLRATQKRDESEEKA